MSPHYYCTRPTQASTNLIKLKRGRHVFRWESGVTRPRLNLCRAREISLDTRCVPAPVLPLLLLHPIAMLVLPSSINSTAPTPTINSIEIAAFSPSHFVLKFYKCAHCLHVSGLPQLSIRTPNHTYKAKKTRQKSNAAQLASSMCTPKAVVAVDRFVADRRMHGCLRTPTPHVSTHEIQQHQHHHQNSIRHN